MAAAKTNQEMLTKLVDGQARVETSITDIGRRTTELHENTNRRIDEVNIRLFGGNGQEGVLTFLHKADEKLGSEIIKLRDTEIRDLRDKDVRALADKIGELETNAVVTSWKLGTISAGAGAGLSIGLTWLAGKLGFHR